MAPQHEYTPRSYTLNGEGVDPAAPRVLLTSSDSHHSCEFSFELLRPGLYRTTFTSPDHPLPPHPSAAPPHPNLGASQAVVTSSDCVAQITYSEVTATVEWKDTPLLSLRFADQQAPVHEDLPHRSYVLNGSGIAHYTAYKRDTLHVGLGEKPAPMDLSNRHFVLSATDCFGYDVYRTDPMYKHIPLLVTASPEGVVGIFSTANSRGTYSVGSEMDGLWGHYKVYRQDYGGLEEYIMVGRTLADVVRLYADVVGYPLRVPRWAFGYLAGGMKYSMLDEPRACDALIAFADKMKEHDIPCSGFQMSSGYTVAETEPKTRNVFTWNRHRFPDPKKFIDEYHSRSIRLIANIKPYVLRSHPEYARLAAASAFFRDPLTNESATARLWSAGGGESGIGGHIDFTSKAGFEWWFKGVQDLRTLGIDCMWNDNNEYTIADDAWQCALDVVGQGSKERAGARSDLGLWGRALNTELMGKSSHDALLSVRPNERPFVLTRSATAATMRYCSSSWSGDNVTSWDGMKGSNALSLTAGMCMLQCYGHDIGGFEGPQPSPELLVRWIQMGIYSSRFAINCWKTSPEDNSVGDVIEPWMYPEVTALVRAAIKRRYELIPYIYSLHLESHMHATPPQRWTGWGYESDPNVWCRELRSGETQFWLGDALLVGGVFSPDVSTARLYLPKNVGDDNAEYMNSNEQGQYYKAGQWVDVESRWRDSIPVLVKVGSAIPVGKNVQVLSQGDVENPAGLSSDDFRAVEIFPARSDMDWQETTWYEDDGVSKDGPISAFVFRYCATASAITIDFEARLVSPFRPSWSQLSVILPAGDTRSVVDKDGTALLSSEKDDKQRSVFVLSHVFGR
ncbi:neutral alpha-glucosidase, partial [Exidia glandulosa HHB12029]